MIISIIEQGLIFAVLALGVYITYKILNFPDLTVDGSIVLGASVVAVLITKEINPILSTIIAVCTGALAGLATGILHVYLNINNILSGILVSISLYSINLRIMNRPNLPIFQYQTLLDNYKLLILILIVIITKIILDLFLKTKLGTLLRITGDNPHLVTSLGVDIRKTKILGLMLANALVALSGALLAQYQGFADINSGTGIIIIGLASVIIGEAILKFKWIKLSTMAIIGAIIYKFIQAMTLQLGLNANDFKLITALTLIVILGINHLRMKKLSDALC